MGQGLITAHYTVKNEEYWLEMSVRSILPMVDSVLIYDMGSTDKTPEIAKYLAYTYPGIRVQLFPRDTNSREAVYEVKNKAVGITDTPWVLQVDGDEIYPLDTAFAMREAARVVIDEVRYVFVKHRDCGKEGLWTLNKGNYTARLLRTEGLEYRGVYPGENKIFYGDVPLNMNRDRRDVYYLPEKYFYFHTTNLCRSSRDGDALNRGVKWHAELGTSTEFYPGSFPEVFGEPVKYSPFGHLLKRKSCNF